MEDNVFELNKFRDRITRNEEGIEKNHKILTTDLTACQHKSDSNADKCEDLNKKIVILDDKIKSLARSGGGGNVGGGGGLGAGALDDIEAAVAKLREDLDNHKGAYERSNAKIMAELAQKIGQAELDDLEARMMQRLQDMFDQLRAMFPDKEALKKKLTALEKNVRQSSHITT